MTVILTVCSMLALYGAGTLAGEALYNLRHAGDRTGAIMAGIVATALLATAYLCTILIHP